MFSQRAQTGRNSGAQPSYGMKSPNSQRRDTTSPLPSDWQVFYILSYRIAYFHLIRSVCRAKALYAYKKNNDDEHTFNAGDVLDIVSKDSENCELKNCVDCIHMFLFISISGWTARLKGVTALAPSNYLEEL